MDTINAVFEQFSKDHRSMARVVQLIEREAHLLIDGGEVDFLLLTDCFGYIKAYPDQFHHPFEDIMFRRLRQRSSESAADIQRLLLEHQELSKLSGALVGQLAAATAGQPVNRATLGQNLTEFTGLN
ncbi:MAG: hemerythrin domain-containing protein, partial [Gammaproteobacteria bacterium]|nr:hemerythrin domain-containing protein [Gammaproteobacteria bacterium]